MLIALDFICCSSCLLGFKPILAHVSYDQLGLGDIWELETSMACNPAGYWVSL